ncbi:uncharacterized protein LOC103313337 isoform X1 [Tribolium castaneum]|uniref:uncharacterized protein LOC103313337 isoform X1 n=2 Tax=Tribolium castaneum TaxID=7070 RepID=UPI0030FE20D2
MFACAILIAPAARSALISNSKVYLWPLSTALSQNPSLVQSPVVQQHKQATLLPAVRSFQTTPVSRDIDSADKFIGAGAATVGVAGSDCSRTKAKMNKSSSLKDSKVRDSEKSLCKLASHEFATIKETITFVDKTLFIKCLLSDTSKIVLLTAPRAFGKTTLMDMLKQFLLGKRSLFENLKICTEETQFFSKHCRSHPVIHIDLGSVRGSSFTQVKHKLSFAINRAFQEHKYLVKKTDDGRIVWTSEKLSISHIDVERFEDFYVRKKCVTLREADLEASLTFLSEVLHTHYEEKVFILIDEYDAPAVGLVFESCPNKDDIRLIHDCLKRFVANTLKFNDFIERSLIFACVRLAGAFSGDAARVIKHYPFLSDFRYAPYLGFTDEEVKQLLELPEVKAACGKVTFKTITKWYDGYMVSNSPLKIFSSWSVLNLLEGVYTTGTLKYSSFWIDTGHVENLRELFAEPSVREKIEELISDSEVKIRRVPSVNVQHLKSLRQLIFLEFDEISEENVELFLQFLADSGYFNILSIDKKKDEIETNTEHFENDSKWCILKIPNFEIKQHIRNVCYSEALATVFEFNLKATSIENYLSALKLVLESTSERAFVDLANAVLVLLSESQGIMNEKEHHHILYTLAYNSKYFEIHSEVQIKKKRKGPGIANTLDMVIISKNVGIIFEYKMNSKSANEALQQIFDKQYYTKFDEPDYKHISKKIYAGLTFKTEEKNVFINYQVGTEGISKSVCSDILL